MIGLYLPPALVLPKEARIKQAEARVKALVDERGGSITATDLCTELVRRGWVEGDATPAGLGLDPADIVTRVHP
jgi:hypothetical protein